MPPPPPATHTHARIGISKICEVNFVVVKIFRMNLPPPPLFKNGVTYMRFKC